jgi:hypothetical protein
VNASACPGAFLESGGLKASEAQDKWARSGFQATRSRRAILLRVRNNDVVFKRVPELLGLILLDHSATFTRYVTQTHVYVAPSSDPTPHVFYGIRIVYAQDLGYGYSRGPLEGFITLTPGNPTDTLLLWTKSGFTRMIVEDNVALPDK